MSRSVKLFDVESRRFETGLRRKAEFLVRRVVPGAQINWVKKRYGFTWDGQLLCPSLPRPGFGATPSRHRRAGDVESFCHQLHDVVHVLLASPRRRRKPECGLGSDPYNVGQGAKALVSVMEAGIEETLVCGLQIALLALWKVEFHDLCSAAQEIQVPLVPESQHLIQIRDYRPDALPAATWEALVSMETIYDRFY